MNKSEMEKKLVEYLDERYSLTLDINESMSVRSANMIFYNGACTAIAQIGSWERKENGKHIVKLN
nr:MAG TPA: hypothetical protein [Caudoviricetes sp.]